MYLNPFFYFSIIFGWSRPGVFTEGVSAVVSPYRRPNKLPGVFRGITLAALRLVKAKRPLCVFFFVFFSSSPPARPRLGVRAQLPMGSSAYYLLHLRPRHSSPLGRAEWRALESPRVLVLGAVCPGVRSPVPVNCVLESRTSSPGLQTE